jgi:hypothetical protein
MWGNLTQTARLLDIFQVLPNFELGRITGSIDGNVLCFSWVPPGTFWDNTGVTGTWAVCCKDKPFRYVFNFRFYRTIRHVEGDIVLHIPYIVALHQEDTSVQSLAKDSHLKDQLEEVVMSWEKHVTTVTDSYLTKVQRIERPGLRKYCKYCALLGCLCMCVCMCVYVCTYICVYVHTCICMYVRTCVCTFDLRTYACKCIQWQSRCSSQTNGRTTVMPVHKHQCVFWCFCAPSVRFCMKYLTINKLKIHRRVRLYYLVLAAVRWQNQLLPHRVLRSSVRTRSMS